MQPLQPPPKSGLVNITALPFYCDDNMDKAMRTDRKVEMAHEHAARPVPCQTTAGLWHCKLFRVRKPSRVACSVCGLQFPPNRITCIPQSPLKFTNMFRGLDFLGVERCHSTIFLGLCRNIRNKYGKNCCISSGDRHHLEAGYLQKQRHKKRQSKNAN